MHNNQALRSRLPIKNMLQNFVNLWTWRISIALAVAWLAVFQIVSLAVEVNLAVALTLYGLSIFTSAIQISKNLDYFSNKGEDPVSFQSKLAIVTLKEILLISAMAVPVALLIGWLSP
jgi:hypothetical protein